MFQPKVSIIIPVYNGSDYISEAIDSAIAQTYKNTEILVINDGSNDAWKTEKIVQSYWKQVKYFYKKNGWVATALNLWIEQMTWEYFSWLSHDDLYLPEKIATQIALLEKIEHRDNVIVFSDFELIDELWKKINDIHIKYSPEQILYKLVVNSFINGCTLLIPKEAFKKVWKFQLWLQHCQDYHLWFRMLKKYSFINASKILVKSRQHAGQDSKSHLFKAMKERKWLENFIFSIYSTDELKHSAGSKLPNIIFHIITKIKLEKYRILWSFYFIAQKLNIDLFLAKIYRKIFKY